MSTAFPPLPLNPFPPAPPLVCAISFLLLFLLQCTHPPTQELFLIYSSSKTHNNTQKEKTIPKTQQPNQQKLHNNKSLTPKTKSHSNKQERKEGRTQQNKKNKQKTNPTRRETDGEQNQLNLVQENPTRLNERKTTKTTTT
jgi:hypothetical protein